MFRLLTLLILVVEKRTFSNGQTGPYNVFNPPPWGTVRMNMPYVTPPSPIGNIWYNPQLTGPFPNAPSAGGGSPWMTGTFQTNAVNPFLFPSFMGFPLQNFFYVPGQGGGPPGSFPNTGIVNQMVLQQNQPLSPTPPQQGSMAGPNECTLWEEELRDGVWDIIGDIQDMVLRKEEPPNEHAAMKLELARPEIEIRLNEFLQMVARRMTDPLSLRKAYVEFIRDFIDSRLRRDLNDCSTQMKEKIWIRWADLVRLTKRLSRSLLICKHLILPSQGVTNSEEVAEFYKG